MQRILVTGNAGSGKTTLAKTLSARLELPLHSLDSIVWQSGWTKTPRQDRDRLIGELIRKELWVIDGVSTLVSASADTIIFLDVPRRVSLWRAAKRNWRYLFRSRPGLPPGCPELLIIPQLVRIIWYFPARIRPGILEQMRTVARTKCVFHIRDNAELRQMLSAI